MNKLAYFQHCLNTQLARDGSISERAVANVQSAAWKLREEDIPADPAQAAFAFFWYCVGRADKPDWLLEAREEEVQHALRGVPGQ